MQLTLVNADLTMMNAKRSSSEIFHNFYGLVYPCLKKIYKQAQVTLQQILLEPISFKLPQGPP